MLSLEKQLLYILKRKPNIRVDEIIYIYEKRAYSSQSIRNALSRLKKDGYINNQSHNYFLTSSGLHFIQAFQKKIDLKDIEWDGDWQLVTYQIPESLRRIRNIFRQELIDLGYGQLFPSVFISPHKQEHFVQEIITDLKIAPFVDIFSGRIIYGNFEEKICDIWNLKDIKQLYNEFISWVRSTRYLDDRKMDSWDAFFHILELGDAFGNILLKDPMLPKKFLPSDWPSREAWQIYHTNFSIYSKFVETNIDIFRLINDNPQKM